MIYGSVCSGIEAASVAWHPLGWRPAFFSEIDRFPRALLAHRFPAVPLHGDFTTIEAGQYEPIDLLVGGTPCQSFSVAGKRLGLDDPRGNLAIEYLRLARRLRPRWLVWENVPGVLSSGDGRDFGAFLGLLGECGYGWAYRVLDAQYFGVPQRRRRVFVVGHLGDWRAAAAILVEPESLRGDSPPRREAGEGVAGGAAFGISSDCFDRSGEGAGGTAGERSGLGIVEDASPALRAKRPNAVAFGGNNQEGPIKVATAVNAHGDPHGRMDFESETFIAHALRGDGFDASEDGSGPGTPLVAVGVALRGRDGGGDKPHVLALHARQDPDSGPVTHPVDTDGHSIAIAFSAKDHGADAGETAPTMRAGGHAKSHANAGVMPAVAFNITPSNRNKDFSARESDRAQALTAGGNRPSARGGDVITSFGVRRLTPRECERLQGFTDDWTLIPWHGGRAPDGPRYRAIGNSMAVPVMRWIGERIEAFQNATASIESGRSEVA